MTKNLLSLNNSIEDHHSKIFTHKVIPKKKENIYKKVDNKKRLLLLKLVKDEKKSLKEAANYLGINYSTAKTILRVFRIEKRILKKTSTQHHNEDKLNLTSSTSSTVYQSNINDNNNNNNNSLYDYTNYYQQQYHQLLSMTYNCMRQIINNQIQIQYLKQQWNLCLYLYSKVSTNCSYQSNNDLS
jgi:hypothetical protein